MVDDLKDKVPDRLHVPPRVRERELLKKGDNFTSTGMDRAAREAEQEDLDAEWKRNLGNVRTTMEKNWGRYSQGGKVTPPGRDATRGSFRTGGPLKQPDFAAGGGILNKKSYSK